MIKVVRLIYSNLEIEALCKKASENLELEVEAIASLAITGSSDKLLKIFKMIKNMEDINLEIR